MTGSPLRAPAPASAADSAAPCRPENEESRLIATTVPSSAGRPMAGDSSLCPVIRCHRPSLAAKRPRPAGDKAASQGPVQFVLLLHLSKPVQDQPTSAVKLCKRHVPACSACQSLGFRHGAPLYSREPGTRDRHPPVISAPTLHRFHLFSGSLVIRALRPTLPSFSFLPLRVYIRES